MMKKIVFAPVSRFSDKRLAMAVTLTGALIFGSLLGLLADVFYPQHHATSPIEIAIGLVFAVLALWCCVNYLKAAWDFFRPRLRASPQRAVPQPGSNKASLWPIVLLGAPTVVGLVVIVRLVLQA